VVLVLLLALTLTLVVVEVRVVVRVVVPSVGGGMRVVVAPVGLTVLTVLTLLLP